MIYRYFYFAILGLFLSCQTETPTLFQSLSTEHTGVNFNNVIEEREELSILSFEYIYNGGGAAIGDLNGDALQDIVFTGNMVDNAIYLNQGQLSFKDISREAGIQKEKRWSSGVILGDVNLDGRLDIYICASGHDGITDKTNLLYINQGNNSASVPVFENRANAYGLADSSNSTHSAFLDYDNDGDLDLFIIVNKMRKDQQPSRYRKKATDGSSPTTDKLYENVWNDDLGHPVFREVGKEAGILTEGFSLGLSICDLNQDGWKDIYITNDYLSNDLVYINNQDGTFTNKSDTYLKHTSFSAMGNEVVDLNNDGAVEIIALDMLPEDNYRRKTMLPPNKYVDYLNNEKFGYQYQFVRNTLQANSGQLPNGQPLFNDIALMSGIAATDWSWTPLVADFDGDGFRDLIVTNGFPRDVTDRDFIDYNMDVGSFATDEFLLDKIPSVRIPNYAFRNKGDLTFEKVTQKWGMDSPSFSNGAAYGDLDNDGDLDYVVNNINMPASVYENRNLNQSNWLRIALKGPPSNPMGVGARVSVYADSLGKQVIDFNPSRGYLSSMEPFLHFGLSTNRLADSVLLSWPDGKSEKRYNVPVNQILTFAYATATKNEVARSEQASVKPLFREINPDLGIAFVHEEVDYIDFNVQPMLLHKLSQYGPGLATGDVNGDGLEDLFISGSHFEKGTFLIQNEEGQFVEKNLIQYKNEDDFKSEELGALFFDADGDGDQDLYVVHGGYEYNLTDTQYIDRLYRNEGGLFFHQPGALPDLLNSGLAVKAADYDRDGDLDLFVGGRVIPANYPSPANSYILKNESTPGNIQFIDATEEVAPFLKNIGMVSDALWSDFDNDQQTDLILAGEFMPLQFLKNNAGVFQNITPQSGVEDHMGWWNSLASGDFDNDGDIDYVAGNTGANTIAPVSRQHPLKVYYKDFDKNGTGDLFPACFFPDQEGKLTEFPYFGRLEIAKQYNTIYRKFPFHKELAITPMNQLFTPEELEDALVLTANNFKTSYFENLGDGRFAISSLPVEIQRSPVYGMQTGDFNQDGYLDLLMVGNDYGMEVSLGRMDAGDGYVAIGDGSGKFIVEPVSKSGFLVSGDAKALVRLQHQKSGHSLFFSAQNRGPIKVHRSEIQRRTIPVEETDSYALLTLKNGQTRRQEFYFGDSFISQSSRTLLIDEYIKDITIFNTRGEQKKIEPDEELSMIDH